MHFPTAEISLFPLLPPLAAFAVSFLTSMGGVSGAFLLLPLQISLGYTNPSVSATNHLFNVIAAPGGVWRYYREGRLLTPLATCAVILEQRLHRLRFFFQGREYACDLRAVFLLTLLIGLTGGIYGIGGGSILAPFLVSGFRLPVHVTAGPTLLCTLVTSTGGVLIYELIAPLYPGLSVGPDWTLGVLFGLGGLAGMYAGARCQKHLPERPVRLLLAVIVLGTALGWLLPLL